MAATVCSALNWWARTRGGRVAIRFGAEQLTYRELDDWSGRLAHRLADEGVVPGDRVGILAPNALQWPVVALAVIKTGAIVVPMNSRLKAVEMRKMADDSGLVAVVVGPDHLAAAQQASSLGRSFNLLGFDRVDDLRSGAADGFCVHRALEDPIAVMFTSGSTGLSKGVILTNQTLLGIVLENTLSEAGFRPGTVTLLVLPLAFTPGLVYGLLITMVLGGTLIVEPGLDPSRAVRLIDQHGVRALFGVPVIWESLSRAPEFETADLSSLQTAIVGGAAVPHELLRRWADKKVLLRQIYGMTEAGGVATATLEAEALDHPDSCGRGSIFTDVRVMKDDGSFADPGEPGELVIRGPGVTPGYWGDEPSTAVAIRDGWLHSGDLGTSDDAGRITFVDRLKDLIISGGINISPVELEATIGALDGVAEVAVIAALDSRWGETPAAIITSDSADLDEAAVIAHCEQHLSDYKIPRYVVLRADPLPRLPSGKIDKRAIRAEYRDVAERYAKAR